MPGALAGRAEPGSTAWGTGPVPGGSVGAAGAVGAAGDGEAFGAQNQPSGHSSLAARDTAGTSSANAKDRRDTRQRGIRGKSPPSRARLETHRSNGGASQQRPNLASNAANGRKA